VRSLIAELGDGYCEELRRTRIGPFDVQDADPQRVLPLGQALAFLPRVEVDADEAWRAGHGQAIAGEVEGEHVLLADADGPVAIAEPREDGLLKPVVGFRG
jgi:tRNA pseudouridine55 synthase